MKTHLPVRINDIAAATGLSRATIDRVMNKRLGVHPPNPKNTLHYGKISITCETGVFATLFISFCRPPRISPDWSVERSRITRLQSGEEGEGGVGKRRVIQALVTRPSEMRCYDGTPGRLESPRLQRGNE
jgi:hypothetical protein